MTTEFSASDSDRESVPPPSETMQQDCERFRLLVENSLDLVVEVTLEGQILYMSPNVQTVLGYLPAELVGSNAYAHVHPDDLAHVQAVFARSERHHATCRYRHKDGSWRWLDTTGRDYVTSSGQPRGVLIARDVTARKQMEAERERLEAELAKAEKLTALGTLAGGVAHDFNNILTAIIAYTTLARMDTQQPHVLDSLGQVLKAADRAKHLAQQILTFSSQQKQKRQALKLSAIVHEVLKLLRPTLPGNLEIVTELHDDRGWVLADATQIHQVLVNLCTNAIHALRHQPGRIELRLTTVDLNEASTQKLAGLRPGPHVRLSVSDTGHGMDRETQRRIFEPLFTTKRSGEGTGLGLAVVRRIVTDHGGAIHVSSQPGVGSEFQLFFPLCAHRSPHPALDPQWCGKGERVLFVDDEPAVCATAAKVLHVGNYAVTTHTDPRTALDLFREQPDAFDLVITDLAMPGLTGVDLAVELLKLRPLLPVLLVSGAFGRWTIEEAREIGIRELLAKPLSLGSLLKAVRHALDDHRTLPTPPSG